MSGVQRHAIEQRIHALAREHGGRLTPEVVVHEAKNPASPLHACFQWDVDKAAWAHWIEQARELIRGVRIEVQTETTAVRVVAYVRDPRVDEADQGYVSVEQLRDDKDLARDALAYEFARAEAALRRAQDLADAFGLSHAVTRLRAGVADASKQIEPATTARRRRPDRAAAQVTA